MYNIKPYDYVPLPCPAKSDRVVAAHYYAAWKYGAAEIHNGFDDLADEYPDRTPLMGYYDEDDPEVCDWEIKWAAEHGINCFIHCWYRKKENERKPVTVNDLRCGHGLHEALFNARYKEFMDFAIMYEASPRWGGTDEADFLENLLPFWTENYFKRNNYLKIDNKPVLFVYNQKRLSDECFKSAESQKETFDRAREYLKTKGFDGLLFAAEINGGRTDEKYKDFTARGYDFLFGYSSGFTPKSDYAPEDEVLNGQIDLFKSRLAIDNRRFIPTASCFYDPSPRFSERWNSLGYKFREWSKIYYLSPESYRRLLREYKNAAETLPDDAWGKRIMMIDNWNEWDEGHFVAPSLQFGFRYLQAIREELTSRDNLPDYRTPESLGFGSYNKSWRTPDFGVYCGRKRKSGEKIFLF